MSARDCVCVFRPCMGMFVSCEKRFAMSSNPTENLAQSPHEPNNKVVKVGLVLLLLHL